MCYNKLELKNRKCEENESSNCNSFGDSCGHSRCYYLADDGRLI